MSLNSRFHVNSALIPACSPSAGGIFTSNLQECAISILELLLISGTQAKVAKSRLLANLSVTIGEVFSLGIAGPLRSSTGISEEYAESAQIGTCAQPVGGKNACSLSRHVIRALESGEYLRNASISSSSVSAMVISR